MLAPKNSSQALRRRVGVGVAAVLALVLALWAVRSVASGDSEGSTDTATSTAQSTSSDGSGDAGSGDGEGSSTSTTTSSSSTSSSSGDAKDKKEEKKKSSEPTLPSYHSTGEYTPVQTESKVRGTGGQLVTYHVRVEKGSGVDPQHFARFIDQVLQHRRGWTAEGEARFQRVATDDADLTLNLATPDTVDEYCYPHGFETLGKVSCTVGSNVMFNLDRWYIGVEHVSNLTVYRQYLINHEIGHYLDKRHQACPGEGEVAPVMLQQTFSLDGCTPNAWPRTADGELYTGPISNG